MKYKIFIYLFAIVAFISCSNPRIKEKKEWDALFESYGIKASDACFEMRDNNHEAVYYSNLPRCARRFTPASTFKIFNSMVAFETAVANDEELVIKWDGVHRMPEWDTDMNMRKAFEVSCVPYYQEIARRIGAAKMKHYIDTIKYGNMNINGAIDQFWLDDSLKISPDEQIGFLKRLYFGELPVSDRSQRLTKTLMLREQTPKYNLYYKTGTNTVGDKHLFWIVGFAEQIEKVKEHKESMNKSDYRYYPYFFAENFEVPVTDTSKNWGEVRKSILKKILIADGVVPAN